MLLPRAGARLKLQQQAWVASLILLCATMFAAALLVCARTSKPHQRDRRSSHPLHCTWLGFTDQIDGKPLQELT